MSITLTQAAAILSASKARAFEIGINMNIAVVDEGGNIKMFLRMDGANVGAADIAIKKARTASLFNTDSGEIGKQSQPGGPLFGIEQTNGGLITFPGGIVLKDQQGKTIGAIGVSGGAVEEDYEVALFGAGSL